MIQCKDCEYFVQGPAGQVGFKCDPFGTIKEPECLVKWQLLRTAEMSQKLDKLVSAYEATLAIYQKFAPMQEKMMRHMEREIEEQDETDAWKYEEEDDDEGEEKP
jgi:hypothetical protein